MTEAAKSIPNLTCPGAVPYTDVGTMFSRAKIFLNTSQIEGFPNTFLQAWVRGVPVVAFFDPDSLIKQRQLGHTATDLEDMVHAIIRLLADHDDRDRIGERARAYAIAQFGPKHIASRYLEMLGRARCVAGPALRHQWLNMASVEAKLDREVSSRFRPPAVMGWMFCSC